MNANPAPQTAPTPLQPFTGYQKFIVGLLAFLQFTIVLDFMILSPLGAILMDSLKITASQFGLVVSAYAFSAGIAGFLSAGFADRFDRKKFLLFFYTGFVVGTFLCGIAWSFETLLAARIVTGIFGGVIGSIVFAIITDVFPITMRGRVMGVVQTSFAASQLLGIPAGLFFANYWGWHAPFMMIVAVSAVVGGVIWFYLKPLNTHLAHKTDLNAFHHLLKTVSTPKYYRVFGFTALITTGGFMLMPFGSAYSVNNLGIGMDKLPVMYLVTGLVSIIGGPYIGKLVDRVGNFKAFAAGSFLSAFLVLIYTNLGITPLYGLVILMSIMFVGISARMISSQALASTIPEPSSRGAFMAVSASVQQISGGLASVLAGLIVSGGSGSPLLHFDILGYVVISSMLLTVVMMYFIDKSMKHEKRY